MNLSKMHGYRSAPVWLSTRTVIAITLGMIAIAAVDAQSPLARFRRASTNAALPTTAAGVQDVAQSQPLAGDSSPELRQAILDRLPKSRLTQDAMQRIHSITKSPTFYRRLPPQAINCDRDLFLFMIRKPEVMVGMWDLMGITNVEVDRLGDYRLATGDGSGTTCEIDLVYGDPHIHIYVADGRYDGKMTAAPIRGRGVFIVTSRYAETTDGQTTVMGTIDCFLQLDSLGADLIARTFRGLIGRSADGNFVETARFIGQVHQASMRNPNAMKDAAARMPQVDPPVRSQFAGVIQQVSDRAQSRIASLPIR